MSALSALMGVLRSEGVLSALDEQLARSLCRLVGETDQRVQLAVALLSRHVEAGHVCLPLGELADPGALLGDEHVGLTDGWPELEPWLDALHASALCDPGEPASPLVIERLEGGERLYLRRHWACERSLARQLLERAGRSVAADPARVSARLDQHFGREPGDLQRRAAELATRRALCVISGGPGTGKTSTVVKILAVAIEEALADGRQAPRIALTAPTGKAAVRLQSAVLQAKHKLACASEVLRAIPEQASTIHRLLAQSTRRDRSEVLAQPDKLAIDLLLVDEASMVDLELMTRLLAALSEPARVILLGDRDQLASVEAGAVLGDICSALPGPPAAPHDTDLAHCIVQLTRSYRYDAASGIGELARAVQAGDARRALAILDDPRYPDVVLHEDAQVAAHAAKQAGAGALLDPQGPFAEAVVEGYGPYLSATDPLEALRRFDQFRVLSAHRQGPRGVVALNREIPRLLQAAALITASDGNYHGRPLLVTENDYRTRLWNGDIGVVSAAEGARVACFVDSDGALRRLGMGRLPPHESAYALSVHKSQGSEVDVVSLVLPSEPSRLLSRELVYTALTRARTRVMIHGQREVLRTAIGQAVSRNTGLRDLLRAEQLLPQ